MGSRMGMGRGGALWVWAGPGGEQEWVDRWSGRGALGEGAGEAVQLVVLGVPPGTQDGPEETRTADSDDAVRLVSLVRKGEGLLSR